jgi:hypothetical protein
VEAILESLAMTHSKTAEHFQEFKVTRRVSLIKRHSGAFGPACLDTFPEPTSFRTLLASKPYAGRCEFNKNVIKSNCYTNSHRYDEMTNSAPSNKKNMRA